MTLSRIAVSQESSQANKPPHCFRGDCVWRSPTARLLSHTQILFTQEWYETDGW